MADCFDNCHVVWPSSSTVNARDDVRNIIAFFIRTDHCHNVWQWSSSVFRLIIVTLCGNGQISRAVAEFDDCHVVWLLSSLVNARDDFRNDSACVYRLIIVTLCGNGQISRAMTD